MNITVKVGDLGTVVTGNTPPRSNPEFYGNYVPFIKATDISESEKYTYTPEEYYSEEGFQKYKTSLIPKNSTCVVTIGSIGKKMTMACQDCFINQAMNAIIPNDDYDYEYVYYLLKNNIHKLKNLDSGTASGRENVSKSAFMNMEISAIKDKATQKRIGAVLSAYDDLIENNQKQIKLLEEAAQRLYKEWFVDLRFPGHESVKVVDGVPEGWKIKKIEEIADTISGGTPSRSHEEYYSRGEILWLKTKELNDGFIFDTEEKITEAGLKNSSAKLFEKGCIILAMYGATIGRLGISSVSMCCNQACCVLKIKERFLFEYIYLWLLNNREMLISRGRGSAQSNLSQELIKQIEVLLPLDGVVIKFSNVLDKLFQNKEILEKQISALCEARDRLLPKLMSGEIEVADTLNHRYAMPPDEISLF